MRDFFENFFKVVATLFGLGFGVYLMVCLTTLGPPGLVLWLLSVALALLIVTAIVAVMMGGIMGFGLIRIFLFSIVRR